MYRQKSLKKNTQESGSRISKQIKNDLKSRVGSGVIVQLERSPDDKHSHRLDIMLTYHRLTMEHGIVKKASWSDLLCTLSSGI